MSHYGFIFAAYAVTAIVLVGLIAWVVADGRTQKAALDELDRRGIRRRSDRAS
ncbi:heme exporter protein CcmD [Microbaculum marinum]|uniref:Heme exporter protein D n=1 Tax=Microbaculum marinum TaxID=1764581 RepID=A0AAW9RSD6_9HYPH